MKTASLIAVTLAVLAVGSCASDETKLADTDCPVLPASSPWNQAIDGLPVHSRSRQIVDSIGADEGAHADFGSGRYGPIGIPYVTVGAGTKRVPVSFAVAGESDAGPYPIPPDAPIEGGPNANGDRHVIVLDESECKLYETFNSFPENGGKRWRADSGAVWDLRSNKQRPRGWTSADAAGLPIFPGLARPEEVQRGKIEHALRITVPTSRRAFVYPASHFASDDTDPDQPAMGERLRLKRSFDTRGFPRQSRVILEALKTYGAIVADNGSAWFISGVPSPRWDDDDLQSLERVPGSAWEVVDTTKLPKPNG